MVKTLQAIEDANVAILVLDAQQEISEQDAHIAGFILEAGPRAGGGGQQVGRFERRAARPRIKREFARKLAIPGLRARALHLGAAARAGSANS